MALRINKDIRIDPVETIYFESDDEFADFCVAPYAVIKQSESGVYYYHGEYSDLYKKAIVPKFISISVFVKGLLSLRQTIMSRLLGKMFWCNCQSRTLMNGILRDNK